MSKWRKEQWKVTTVFEPNNKWHCPVGWFDEYARERRCLARRDETCPGLGGGGCPAQKVEEKK
jgi:hypothetical protein